MATLGDTSEPTSTAEAHSAAVNHFGHVVTMPAGGPWKITKVAVWAAGYGSSCQARTVVWNGSSGAIEGYSAEFTMTQRTFAPSGSDLYDRAVFLNGVSGDVVISGGQTLIIGFAIPDSDAAFFGRRATGSHREKDTAYLGTMASNTTHSVGAMGAYLTYEASNSAPLAPTLNDPTGGELVASQTPTLNFTPDDPDGDNHTGYTYQVDNNSDFSSPVESTEVNGTFTDGVAINRVVTSTLTRGTTYYWRVKTKDAANGYGAYSAGASFKVASLPTATLTAPGSAEAAELYYTAGSNTTPKIKARWTFSCPDGGTQTQAIIRIYADAAGSPGSLLNTDTYNGSNSSYDTTYAVTEGTYYHVSVQVTCSHTLQGAESTKHRCRTRWGRASYYFNSGSTPTTLSVAANTTVGANQAIVLEYSTTVNTTEPTTWYSSVAAAGLKQYFWHRATILAWGSSPTSPTLNDVTWSYSASTLVPDHWTLASGASIDQGTFVFGEQSLKHATNGAEQFTYQIFPVTSFTNIILSGKIKTLGQPNAQLRIYDADGTVLLDSVSASADTDWKRYSTAVINTGSATSLRAVMRTNATAGASAWFDIQKVEASTVVTPWTPGFLGATKLDAGGIMVDGSRGGVFRLRGSAGGTRDQVDLGTNGLQFGGATSPVNLSSPSADLLQVDDDFKVAGSDLYLGSDVRLVAAGSEVLQVRDAGGANLSGAFDLDATKLRWGGSSFPSSPATNDLFYRTDRDLLYYYDGTRWLSVHLYIENFSGIWTTYTATTRNQVLTNPANVYGQDVWVEYFQQSYFLTSGTGTDLSASHKWTANLQLDAVDTGTSIVVDTNGAGLNVWRHDKGPTAVNDVWTSAEASYVSVNLVKTGTPHNMTAIWRLAWRLVG